MKNSRPRARSEAAMTMRPAMAMARPAYSRRAGRLAQDDEGEERAEQRLQPHDDGGWRRRRCVRGRRTSSRSDPRGTHRRARAGGGWSGAGERSSRGRGATATKSRSSPGGEEEAVGGDREGRGFVGEAHEDGGPGDAKHADEQHGQRRPGNRHGRHATGARGGEASAPGGASPGAPRIGGWRERSASGLRHLRSGSRPRSRGSTPGKGCGAGGRCFPRPSTRRHARTCVCWTWRRRWRA